MQQTLRAWLQAHAQEAMRQFKTNPSQEFLRGLAYEAEAILAYLQARQAPCLDAFVNAPEVSQSETACE